MPGFPFPCNSIAQIFSHHILCNQVLLNFMDLGIHLFGKVLICFFMYSLDMNIDTVMFMHLSSLFNVKLKFFMSLMVQGRVMIYDFLHAINTGP